METKKYINSLTDLRQWFSEQLVGIDPNCYTNLDDLDEWGTDNLWDLLRSEYGFEWGDPIPDDLTCEQIFACIDEWEI